MAAKTRHYTHLIRRNKSAATTLEATTTQLLEQANHQARASLLSVLASDSETVRPDSSVWIPPRYFIAPTFPHYTTFPSSSHYHHTYTMMSSKLALTLSVIAAAQAFTLVPSSTSSKSTANTALHMGLFDGVKDAFAAPALERSTIDAERETPIDRWMGWSVVSENDKKEQSAGMFKKN